MLHRFYILTQALLISISRVRHKLQGLSQRLQKPHNTIYPNLNCHNTLLLHHLPRRTRMADKPAEESLRRITQRRSTSPFRTLSASKYEVLMQDEGPSRLSSWRNDSTGRNHGNAGMAERKVIYAWSATLQSR